MTINTNVVEDVLKAWANSYIEDVPAQHKNGQYLIEYETLVDHMNNISNDTLVEIMLEVNGNYI